MDATPRRGLYLGLTLMAAHLLLLQPRYALFMTNNVNDEAIMVLGAQRWLQGEWPYRDWFTLHTPGGYALAAAWFKLFGSQQLGQRSLMALLAALQGLVVYQLASPLSPGWRLFAWLCWAALGLLEVPILNYHWVAIFWFSLAALAAQSWVGSASRTGATLTGVFVALAGWTLQSEGLAGVLLIVGCAVLWRPPHLARVVTSLLLTTILVFAPVLPFGGEVWRSNVQRVLAGSHNQWNRYPYGWSRLAPGWVAARQSSWTHDPSGALYAWQLCWWRAVKYGGFPLVLLAAAWWSVRRRQRSQQCLALATTLLTLTYSARLGLDYQSYLLPLWFPQFSWLLSQMPRSQLWRAGLSAALLAFIVSDNRILNREYRYPVDTRAGRYYSDDPRVPLAFGVLGDWAAQVTSRNEECLCFPFLGSLYTLYGIRNPVRYTPLVPFDIGGLEIAREVAEQLEQRQVPWILYVPIPPAVIAADHLVSPQAYAEMQDAYYRLLTRNYALFRSAYGMQLLHRKPGPPS